MADERPDEMIDPQGEGQEPQEPEPSQEAGETDSIQEGAGLGDALPQFEDFEKTPEQISAEQALLDEQLAATEDDAGAIGTAESGQNVDLLMDVTLTVTVELGRKEMKFEEILELGRGSLVELNKVADEPVDIYVNQSKVAYGEVVVVDDHFGVRITRILNTERLRRTG